jgi:hypothetical protein
VFLPKPLYNMPKNNLTAYQKPKTLTKLMIALVMPLVLVIFTQAPALIGQNSDYQQLADDAASAYALQLAALVKAASANTTGNTPALELLNKLAADLSDGIIDGKNDMLQLLQPYLMRP